MCATTALDEVYKENAEMYNLRSFQFFGAAETGVSRMYPGVVWGRGSEEQQCETYDPRLRPWSVLLSLLAVKCQLVDFQPLTVISLFVVGCVHTCVAGMLKPCLAPRTSFSSWTHHRRLPSKMDFKSPRTLWKLFWAPSQPRVRMGATECANTHRVETMAPLCHGACMACMTG